MADIHLTPQGTKKRCFVVMGFGTKTDFATGRKLNLDYSYNALIKPVVESKGLVCVRADEIRHTGTIDVPMYQELLTADIVVADLSTANPNALYELGIRHAMRPRTTIVISEQQLNYPFDLNHILITKYKTLGESIEYFEVLRFQKILGETIDTVLNNNSPDSPVYTFLDNLIPPSLKEKAEKMSKEVKAAINAKNSKNENNKPGTENAEESQTLSLLVKQGEAAIKSRNFELAKSLFRSAIEISKSNSPENNFSNNPYLIQRLALATYKAKKPDVISSLNEAINTLNQLNLNLTNDTETVALAGRIEKRLYYYGQGDEHLRNAIIYFERGYYLLSNRYHGINLAFLINNRVNSKLYNTPEDNIADMMWASRYRREVLSICEKDLDEFSKRKKNTDDSITISDDAGLALSQETIQNEEEYWILVNKAEAHFGLGEMEEYKKADEMAKALKPTSWDLKGYETQVEDLRKLLLQYGHLLNPPWTDNSKS
jgi:hypothetical protein